MEHNPPQSLMTKMAMLGLLMLLGACASTATGTYRSASALRAPAEPLKAKAPAGTVLVVIRYPAIVDPAARDAYQQAYAASPIGGAVSRQYASSTDSAAIADSTIVKSSYFALSLYQELVKRLPEHTVLLSPHLVKLDGDGHLVSEPVTRAESLGSALTIDFATYSFPDLKRMMGNTPLTFGDLVTPLVVVRTDHRAAPATDGILLASQPLLAYAGGQGRESAARSLQSLEAGKLDTTPPAHAFVAYLANGDQARLASQPLTLDPDKNAVQIYPLEKIRLDDDELRALEADDSGAVDPLANAFSSAFADRIVAMLNHLDMDKAVMVGKAAAVAGIDPSLAALTVAGSPDEDYQARLRYAERLLEAERKYLSVQSLRIYDGIRNGEMGAQVRDMLMAEHDVLEERRSLARKQNAAAFMAVLGVVAASAISSNNKNNSYGDTILSDAILGASVYAGTQVFAYKRRSKVVGSNYFASIVPALDEQTSVQVNLIDSNETITAIRFEDLQAKLKGLYTKNQRALDTIATRCQFLPATEDGDKGVWTGACKDGLAGGQGIGVLRLAGGSSREYFGAAENGRAQGRGYMIVHDKTGDYGIDGYFTDGRPEGIARVSKPGRRVSLHRFRAGKDVGLAPRDASIAPPPADAAGKASPVAVRSMDAGA